MQVRKVGIVMKGFGPVNTITSFCRDKCGNFDQNPTAGIKSYWEPGYRDTPLFPRLVVNEVNVDVIVGVNYQPKWWWVGARFYETNAKLALTKVGAKVQAKLGN